MKVSVNIQPLLHNAKSGVGFYEAGLLQSMVKKKDTLFALNYFSGFKNRKVKEEKVQNYLNDNVKIGVCKWFSATIYQMLWAFFPIPYRLFFHEKADISQFFNYYIPPGVNGKKVVVIYDTVIKDFPETVRLKTKVMLKLTLKKSIKRADKIITISDFSKKCIMHHFSIDEQKIEVIPCGVDHTSFKKIDDQIFIESIKQKYRISGEYFLYLGNLEPRKNIERLIEAYALALKERRNLPTLVIAGGKGWLYSSIFQKVKQLDIAEQVHFTGYVEDDDVPVLMNGAQVFCFPSLYEGFGMPPLEAMACGTPVLVSHTSSIPEVVGECGIYVNPYSVEQISQELIRLSNDVELRNELEKRGLERSRMFSWDISAEKLVLVYKKILEK